MAEHEQHQQQLLPPPPLPDNVIDAPQRFRLGEMRQVRVRTATGMLDTGRSFTIMMNGTTSVSSLKTRIESESGIPATFQKLLYGGKVLDYMILGKIPPDHTIDLAPNGTEAARFFAAHLGSTDQRNPVVTTCINK